MAFTIGAALFLLVLVLITVAVVLGVSVALGWLLTWLLPFSLFEATLLTMVALVLTAIIWYFILKPRMDEFSDEDDVYEEESDYYLHDPAIPQSRFCKNNAEQTWEAWVRFTLSNSIFEEMSNASPPLTSMGEPQQHELAIRLADAAVGYLKTRRKNSKTLTISLTALKKQLVKNGQQPYDSRIMQVAVNGINYQLQDHMLDYILIIQDNQWRQPCSLFEEI